MPPRPVCPTTPTQKGLLEDSAKAELAIAAIAVPIRHLRREIAAMF